MGFDYNSVQYTGDGYSSRLGRYGARHQNGRSYVSRDRYRQDGVVRGNKHSGAKWVTDKKNPDRPTISAWKWSRKYGLISVIACERKDALPKEKTAKNANYLKWVVTLQIPMQGQKTFSGLFNTATRKLYVPDCKWVINPSAPNGGYCGSCSRPKNR